MHVTGFGDFQLSCIEGLTTEDSTGHPKKDKSSKDVAMAVDEKHAPAVKVSVVQTASPALQVSTGLASVGFCCVMFTT